MVIASLLSGFSNRVIDCVLSQDPRYYEDLQVLAGKKIIFTLVDIKLQVVLNFTRTTMTMTYGKNVILEEGCALYLEGRSMDLLAFSLYKNKRSRLLSIGLIQFQGDLFLLEAMVVLFKDRDFLQNVPMPLWMKQILLQGSKRFFSWNKHNVSVIKHSVVDYAVEELHLLPSAKHFRLLQDDLLMLNESLDRVEARLAALSS